jgi:hypothetical protein
VLIAGVFLQDKMFNEVYAYRIGTGYVGSAYGPLRRVFVRLSVPFS